MRVRACMCMAHGESTRGGRCPRRTPSAKRCGALHGGTWQCVPCASAEYGRRMDRASPPWSTRRVRSAHSSTCNTLATFAEYPPSTPSVPSPAARCSTSRRGPTAPRSRTRGPRAGCLRNSAQRALAHSAKAAALRANAPTPEARTQTHKQTLARTHARTNKQATGAHSPSPRSAHAPTSG
jgi:hypothetical protein